MELLSLFAKIGIDDKEYNNGIKSAESKASKLGKGMKTAFKVGAAAVGVTTAAVAGVSKAFTNAAKETAAYGDNVDKMSQKIGISAEAYQKWDYVMQRAGGSVDSLKMGMKTLSQQAEKNSDAFQKLGISQEEVANLSQEELFEKTVKGLSAMEAGTERTTLATQLLGRAGANMGPLLNQGSAAIEEQMKIAEKYGMVMSDEAVKASAEWTDSMTTLSMTTTGLKNRLMGEFLPALTEVTDGLALVFTGDYEQGVEKMSQGFENLTSGIMNSLPKVLEVGSNIVLNLVDSIVANLPMLFDTGVSIILKIAEGLIKQLPTVLQSGLQILLSIITGITSNVGELIPAIYEVIAELVTTLTAPDMLTQLITAALELILALADGFVKGIPQLTSVLPTVVDNVVTTLIKLAPKLLVAAAKLIVTLGKGMLDSRKAALDSIVKIGEGIKDKIKGLVDRARGWGRDMLQNFINGISEKIKALRDKITSVANTISDRLHFSVPDEGPLANADKWMPDFMDLLSSGIEQHKFKVENAIDELAGGMTLTGVAPTMTSSNISGGDDGKQIELVFREGTAPLQQIARLIFPYLENVRVEKGLNAR